MHSCGVQLMHRSATLAPPYTATAPVVAVYGAVRGLGLLASASGILTAPARCQELLQTLLATSTVDKRTDHLLLGAAAGMSDDVTNPTPDDSVGAAGLVPPTTAAHPYVLEHGIPATPMSEGAGYAVQGLNALQAVQDKALQLYRTKTPQLPSGLDVLLVQPMSESGMRRSESLVDFLTGQVQFDVHFTAPVKRKLRDLGGQFERLRSMRAGDVIKPFESQDVRIIIQNASLYPLRHFRVPADPLRIIVGPPELGQQAIDEHQRANVAQRAAGWEHMSPPMRR